MAQLLSLPEEVLNQVFIFLGFFGCTKLADVCTASRDMLNKSWKLVYYYEFMHQGLLEYGKMQSGDEPQAKRRRTEKSENINTKVMNCFLEPQSDCNWLTVGRLRHNLVNLNNLSVSEFIQSLQNNSGRISSISKHVTLKKDAESEAFQILVNQYCRIRQARAQICKQSKGEIFEHYFAHNMYFAGVYHVNNHNPFGHNIEMMNKVVLFHPVTGIPAILETIFTCKGEHLSDGVLEIYYSPFTDSNSLLYSLNRVHLSLVESQVATYLGRQRVREHRFKYPAKSMFDPQIHNFSTLFKEPLIDKKQEDTLRDLGSLLIDISFVSDNDFQEFVEH